MKILVVHNRYQIAGGEDVVVAQEVALLRVNGLEVRTFFVDNDAITTPLEKMSTAAAVVYSWEMRERVARALAEFRPDLMHVHNTFPRLSPSIYDAAVEAGCPVVQTIHNFRLVCLKGTLFREGKVCLDCADRQVAWPGVRHGCYRDSVAGSASVALMLAVNHLRGAWSERVDRFLMLTPFARDFFVENTNIPREKMRIKPNAAPDPGMGRGEGGYALFVGRLAAEKGIGVLLAAARSGLGMPLKIAGQGPLTEQVREAHAAGYVEYLGPQDAAQLRRLMQDAACLLVPSLWYEGLPMVIPEAFGAGLPVVASAIGSLATLVEHEQTGLLVRAGDATDLAAACRRLAADRPLLERMRRLARTRYMLSYQPAPNFDLLMSIYRELVPGLSTAALTAPVLHPGLASPGFRDRPTASAGGAHGSGS